MCIKLTVFFHKNRISQNCQVWSSAPRQETFGSDLATQWEPGGDHHFGLDTSKALQHSPAALHTHPPKILLGSLASGGGQFSSKIRIDIWELEVDIYIVERLCRPLLSQHAIECRKLLASIGEIKQESGMPEEPCAKFSQDSHICEWWIQFFILCEQKVFCKAPSLQVKLFLTFLSYYVFNLEFLNKWDLFL